MDWLLIVIIAVCVILIIAFVIVLCRMNHAEDESELVQRADRMIYYAENPERRRDYENDTEVIRQNIERKMEDRKSKTDIENDRRDRIDSMLTKLQMDELVPTIPEEPDEAV